MIPVPGTGHDVIFDNPGAFVAPWPDSTDAPPAVSQPASPGDHSSRVASARKRASSST